MRQSMSRRMLAISTPALAHSLAVTAVRGEDALADAFSFDITAHVTAHTLDTSSLIDQPLGVAIYDANTHSEQYIHGIIQGVSESTLHKSVVMTIRPWFFMLDYSCNRASFQGKSIIEVMEIIFRQHQFMDYDFSALKAHYPKEKYIVQFDETDFAFVSRLMQQAGIYYYFSYDTQSHTMHIVDNLQNTASVGDIVLDNQHGHVGAHIYNWRPQERLIPFAVSSTRYDSDDVYDNHEQSAERLQWRGQERHSLTQYQHAAPGVQAHFDAMRAAAALIEAATNSAQLLPGVCYKIKDDEDAIKYLVTRRRIDVHERAYGTHNTQNHESKAAPEAFESKISSLSCDHVYAYSQTYNKPTIIGTQLAGVVGPEGEDVYMDAAGKIKIRFYWDVSNVTNLNASCWVRYAQPVAGNNFGCFATPRVGQDVMVSFINGDPDRPIVTGVVYNDANVPPYDPIKEPKTSGIKTHSLNSDGHNELKFSDQDNNEFVYLKAQKDLSTVTGHDARMIVKGHQTVTVAEGDQLLEVKQGSYTLQAGDSLELKSHNSRIHISDTGIQLMAPVISINGGPLPETKVPPAPPPMVDVQQLTKISDGVYVGNSLGGLLGPVDGIVHPPKVDATGASAITQPGGSSVVEDPDTIPFAEIAMDTQTKKLYFLTSEDMEEFNAAGAKLHEAIAGVYEATSSQHKGVDADAVRRADVDAAQEHLNETLKPLVSGPGKNTISEMVLLKGKKYTYVHSKKIKSHWRSYQLREGDLHEDKVDFKHIKSQLKKSTKLSLGSYDKNYSTSLCDWAQKANNNGSLKKVLFDGKSFNATNDAKLLRYTAGLSLAGEFKPYEGIVSFSGNASTQLTIASDKFEAKGYIPSIDGWSLVFHPCFRNGRVNYDNPINFGAIRVTIDTALSAFVGASALASANIDLSLKHDGDPNKAKLALKGTNLRDKVKEKAKAAKVEVGGSVFAGAKAGGDIGAKIEWKNPETMKDHPKTFAAQQALAVKLKKMTNLERDALMDWCELASLDAGAEFACGVGATGEFHIGYEPKAGKFVMHAKAALVCGPGVSGDFGIDIDAEHLLEFVQYVYHKIKGKDFAYIGFMEADALEVLVQLFTKYIIGEALAIADVAVKELTDWWGGFYEDLLLKEKKQHLILKMINGVIEHPDHLRFTPPEAKGRMLRIIMDEDLWDIFGLDSDEYIRQQAACLLVLAYVQCQADYNNVMQHMTLMFGQKISVTEGEKLLYKVLRGDGINTIQNLQWFHEIVKSNDETIVYPAKHFPNQPVRECIDALVKRMHEEKVENASRLSALLL